MTDTYFKVIFAAHRLSTATKKICKGSLNNEQHNSDDSYTLSLTSALSFFHQIRLVPTIQPEAFSSVPPPQTHVRLQIVLLKCTNSILWQAFLIWSLIIWCTWYWYQVLNIKHQTVTTVYGWFKKCIFSFFFRDYLSWTQTFIKLGLCSTHSCYSVFYLSNQCPIRKTYHLLSITWKPFY